MSPEVPRHGMHQAPRATVLVPVLNNRAFIGTLLHSLLRQWQPGIDLLLVDDGSTDGSFEAAREAVAAHPGVDATMLRNPAPLGVGQLPSILRHVAAPIIIQADSDDVALPGRLAATLACFEEDPDCRLVTSNAVLVSETGVPIGVLDGEQGTVVIRGALHAAVQVGSKQWFGATAAYHRSLLDGFPALDPALCPYGLDLLLPLRALLLGTHHYLAQPYVGWRQHGRNSHKLAGAGSAEDEALERHGALELMALGQRIRDIGAVRGRHPDPASLDEVVSACQRTFLSHFEHWSRSRNRLVPQVRPGAAVRERSAVAQVPPLLVLRPGVRLAFGTEGRLGTLTREWSGFHPPERQLNWIARTAVLTFGLAGGQAETVILGLRSGGLPMPRRLRLSVDLGPVHEFEVRAEDQEIRLPVGQAAAPGMLTVLLHVPDAMRPAETGLNEDVRLLGVQLLFIEVE